MSLSYENEDRKTQETVAPETVAPQIIVVGLPFSIDFKKKNQKPFK